jgi:hypothetical protein
MPRSAMHTLKLVFLTLLSLVKQAWFLPRNLAQSFKTRRQQVVLDEREIERLDRIRNPDKYLGG